MKVQDKWRVQQEGQNVAGNPVFVIVGEDSAIAKVYTAFEGEQPGRARRNAYLIAAAPELLAALTALIDSASWTPTDNWRIGPMDSSKGGKMEMARMAIAKAQGRGE